jgi:hypothetical protein
MARRNRPTTRRVQRAKNSIPARLERVIDQLFTDAADALIYMSTDNQKR